MLELFAVVASHCSFLNGFVIPNENEQGGDITTVWVENCRIFDDFLLPAYPVSKVISQPRMQRTLVVNLSLLLCDECLIMSLFIPSETTEYGGNDRVCKTR